MHHNDYVHSQQYTDDTPILLLMSTLTRVLVYPALPEVHIQINQLQRDILLPMRGIALFSTNSLLQDKSRLLLHPWTPEEPPNFITKSSMPRKTAAFSLTE